MKFVFERKNWIKSLRWEDEMHINEWLTLGWYKDFVFIVTGRKFRTYKYTWRHDGRWGGKRRKFYFDSFCCLNELRMWALPTSGGEVGARN